MRSLDIAGVAARTGLAVSTIRTYVRKGIMEPPDDHNRDGQPVWKPSTVDRWFAGRPSRGAKRPQVECGTVGGWRWPKCGRCDRCRGAHNLDSRDRRRVTARIPDDVRAAILEKIAGGEHISEVAESFGLTTQKLHAQSRFDQEWSDLLDDALTAGRDNSFPHPGSYRRWNARGCRCPECRKAHHDPVVPNWRRRGR